MIDKPQDTGASEAEQMKEEEYDSFDDYLEVREGDECTKEIIAILFSSRLFFCGTDNDIARRKQ